MLLVVAWWVLWRTPFGLRLRSCGEPAGRGGDVGVNVIRYKFIAVLISGGLAGLAGGFLVLVGRRTSTATARPAAAATSASPR